MSEPSPAAQRWRRHLVLGVALAVFGVALVQSAWLCDDAYITLRTVRNFVLGDGLRWNLAERVQSYTHPLWMLVLSAGYAVTREAYFTTLALAGGCSLAVVAMIGWRSTARPWLGAAAILTLASSRSFVDYATSGLENPLSHLLLVVLILDYASLDAPTPARLARLAVVAALAVVNRADHLLLVAPILAAAWWRGRSWRGVGAIALGFAPLALWLGFATIYYGFPLPNTAYAKLPASIGLDERLAHGGHYLWYQVGFDRVSVVVLGAGLVAPLVARRWRWAPLSAALALYLGYIAYVGGDFMAGRFFTAPLVVAVVMLVKLLDEAPPLARLRERPRARAALAGAAIAAVVGLGLSHGGRASLTTGRGFGAGKHWSQSVDAHGIADEREVYYPDLGLVRRGGAFAGPRHRWLDRGARLAPGSVTTAMNVGLLGWAAPRTAHIVDLLALTDPLLARLPPVPLARWRPGHLGRLMPDGYAATLAAGASRFPDPAVGRYWDDLALATRGPVWRASRFAAIWRLNTGADDHLLARANDRRIAAAAVRQPAPEPYRLLPASVLTVDFPPATSATTVEVCVDGDDRYQIEFWRAGARLTVVEVAPGRRGLTTARLAAPGTFDQVRIAPRGGDGRYAVGCVRPAS
jgi:arabinofuranosyltransferase